MPWSCPGGETWGAQGVKYGYVAYQIDGDVE